MKILVSSVLAILALTAPAFATVVVSAPYNGETVSGPVQFIATATTATCSRGVASMGVYVNNQLKTVQDGTRLNASVSLAPGSYRAVVEEWDYCGGATTTVEMINVANGAGVHVATPANNSAVSDPVSFVASATSGCPQGVAAMGIYVNNTRVYLSGGANLNTQLNLPGGTQHAVVQEWDRCGGSTTAPATVNVQGGQGKVLSGIQAAAGWNQWGELPPVDAVCSYGCQGVNWGMNQHVSSPSESGNATRFYINGTKPYADALFSNPIMGQGSKLIPDTGHSLIPTLHNFTYDADFYVTNAGITQALEFDVNMYLNSVGMEWGTECNHLADGDWDVWDNVNAHWNSTGAPCRLQNGWNHVTITVQRESNNYLLYKTITLNGVTYNINRTYPPFSVPASWYGMTVNYQMDGNYNMSANTTYLDNFNLTYW